MAEELMTRFSAGVEAPWPDFDAVAARVFAVQYEGNAPYRAFCEARGVSPDALPDWRHAPLVPATAFKHLDLVVGDPDRAELRFRTSGTTGGAARRGVHRVRRADLYQASLLPPLLHWLLPDGVRPTLLSLVPAPDRVPDSSLSHMVGVLGRSACEEVVWGVDPDAAPDPAYLAPHVRRSVERGQPVLVAGTAFAFVHLLDALAREGVRWFLPEGSRVMETGGFKGRSREVGRAELYDGIRDRLGVPPSHVVNEYGMTELLSQCYEPVLRGGPPDLDLRGHHPPPWLAVRAVDPLTLEEVPAGQPGLLAFYDLANLGSVSAVLTQDVGSVIDGRVHLTGRAPGSEPRGCSLAMEQILAANGNEP